MLMLFVFGVSAFKLISRNQMGILICVSSQAFLFAYMRSGQKTYRTAALILNGVMIAALLNFELKTEPLHTPHLIYETGTALQASEAFAEEAGKSLVEANNRSRDEWRIKMRELHEQVQSQKRELELRH